MQTLAYWGSGSYAWIGVINNLLSGLGGHPWGVFYEGVR